MTIALSTDSLGRPIIEDGGMVWLEGRDALQKMLNDRLQFFKGSCVFSRDAGVDMSWLGGKGTFSQAQSALRDAILETPGVVEILKMDITLDKASRLISGDIAVLSEDGSLEVSI